jgi:hypothetical protein
VGLNLFECEAKNDQRAESLHKTHNHLSVFRNFMPFYGESLVCRRRKFGIRYDRDRHRHYGER